MKTIYEEALNLLYNYAVDEWNLGTSARKLIDGAYAELEKALNELNTLKNDVARYFELSELQSNEVAFPTEYLFTDDDWRELYFLEEKLSKVGKE